MDWCARACLSFEFRAFFKGIQFIPHLEKKKQTIVFYLIRIRIWKSFFTMRIRCSLVVSVTCTNLKGLYMKLKSKFMYGKKCKSF